MEQLERITYMEQALDISEAGIAAMREALEAYHAAQDKIQELFMYYSSRQWMDDYDDGCAGKLPNDLKCGVLSQDAVHSMLEENNDLMVELEKLVQEHSAKL